MGEHASVKADRLWDAGTKNKFENRSKQGMVRGGLVFCREIGLGSGGL